MSTPTTEAHHGPVAGFREVGMVLQDLQSSAGVVLGVHPLDSPLTFTATGDARFEVCPSDYLGNTDPTASSWNRAAGFVTCRSNAETPAVEVPAAGSEAHRWVVVRPTEPSQRTTELQLAYTTADGFFQVSSLEASTGVTVSFAPATGTFGVLATDIDGTSAEGSPTAGITPAGLAPVECDFPSEVTCVGPITPGALAMVQLSAQRGGDGVFISWSSATQREG